jgi:hypothetical protein
MNTVCTFEFVAHGLKMGINSYLEEAHLWCNLTTDLSHYLFVMSFVSSDHTLKHVSFAPS